MDQTATVTDAGRADELRQAMTDQLVADGWIGSPEVEAAFRSVPRHLFVPADTSLEETYSSGRAVVTKRDDDGASLSSVSAPWLQARMIAQAGVEAGMRVLEVGSGGYNAALLAELVGDEGRISTVDIDPEVTARARAALDVAGYGDRVTVVTADAEHGLPDRAPYDAIVVTVGAWDLPPALRDQVATDGTLVVPLRMNTVTRSIAFRRQSDHWRSTSAEMCGFVPMQGLGARAEREVRLTDRSGGQVTLLFDDEPEEPSDLGAVLASDPVHAWTGLTIGRQVSFADLYLWLAGFLPGFCRVDAGEGTALRAEGTRKTWFPFGGALGDSLTLLELRPTGTQSAEHEFGARGYGPRAHLAADVLAAEITKWDAHGRDIPDDGFGYWPAPAVPSPGDEPTSVFPKTHGAVTITWPAAG